jgi:hypothetical protein
MAIQASPIQAFYLFKTREQPFVNAKTGSMTEIDRLCDLSHK